MQKIKNPILCWIVILAVFIRPTPAQAMVPLAAVAVGAVIAATGVMVAGAGVYKPPTFASTQIAVDSVVADIKRDVVVARMVGAGVTAGLKGFSSSYTLDGQKVFDWVNAYSPSFPSYKTAYDASLSPVSASPVSGDKIPPVPGDTNLNAWLFTGVPTSVDTLFDRSARDNCQAVGIATNVITSSGIRILPGLPNIPRYINRNVRPSPTSEIKCIYTQDNLGTAVVRQLTPDTTYPPPRTLDKPVFAASLPRTESVADETDRIAAENPAAVKIPPQSITPEQIKEASKQAEKTALESAAVVAEGAAAADPTNTALQIAAQQARSAADLAAIEADQALGEIETTPEEAEKTDTPPPAGPVPDADLALDFSPFLGLQDKAMSKFPFSMVSSLGSLFSGLTSAPVTPSMDVPMPWGMAPKQITLSHWDDFAGKWRMMIALFFHASCIYAIIRRYS